MKIQFDAKSNNTQVADDDTTTQVQIGRLPLLFTALIITAVVICWLAH